MPSDDSPPRVLVADDQGDVLEALRLLLKAEGFRIETARSPSEVVNAVEHRDFDVTLLDLNYARDTTSGREGLDLVESLQRIDGTLPVIVMTAWGSIESAVEAMRRGARDYIEKPWDNARLIATLRTQVELARALRRTQLLESENRLLRRDGTPQLIAESPAMQPILRLVERVGPSEANVLITGEHGTGKELIAHYLHALSPRSGRALVTVNMGGLAETVFESEMFGHVKGAFTDARSDRVGRFELAHEGTLFLDEIANIPLAQQSKLLRVLQTGELERVGSSKTRQVDTRVISATNADLRREVDEGRFREDLLFRLNTIEIALPPLRERREDIPALAMHFLRRHAQRYRKGLTRFDSSALQALLAHSWPGNVRELDHGIERAVLMARGDAVRGSDLALRPAGGGSGGGGGRLEDMTLEEVERVLIQKALERHAGNVSQAAKLLGLSRSALYRRLSHHGL
ncbi:MAG TPA: sigma-54 dependent transcriptional regulator [Gemmatimonadaceae bacterium]|nr:sigma-54 dependent transcriptional regulator [Gemmatimonadaceae bacterium]